MRGTNDTDDTDEINGKIEMEYVKEFFKLAGKCFAWVAGLGFVAGALFTLISRGQLLFVGTWLARVPLMGLVAAVMACFYTAIPVLIFVAVVITLRKRKGSQ